MSCFYYGDLIRRLKEVGVIFDKALLESEIMEIEAYYKISFPYSLKCFYMQGLPISQRYPRWNDFSCKNVKKILAKLRWPLEGLFFDRKWAY